MLLIVVFFSLLHFQHVLPRDHVVLHFMAAPGLFPMCSSLRFSGNEPHLFASRPLTHPSLLPSPCSHHRRCSSQRVLPSLPALFPAFPTAGSPVALSLFFPVASCIKSSLNIRSPISRCLASFMIRTKNLNDCVNSTPTQSSLGRLSLLKTCLICDVAHLALSVVRPEVDILRKMSKSPHISCSVRVQPLVCPVGYSPSRCLQTPLNIRSSILMRVFRRQISTAPDVEGYHRLVVFN